MVSNLEQEFASCNLLTVLMSSTDDIIYWKDLKKCLDVLSSVESVTLSWFLSPWEMCLSPCFPSLIRTLSTVTFSLMRQTISESVRSSKISTNIFSFTFVLHNRVTELHTLVFQETEYHNIRISSPGLVQWQ